MTKRIIGWLGTSVVVALLSGCSLGQVNSSAPPPGPYQVVRVTAQNWSWTMSSTRLKAGEEVKFVVRSIEAVHGFSVMGTNISTAVTQGDPPAVIYWKPVKGIYTLACNVYCGAGHDTMHTTFSVS